jgi:integrase
MKIKNLDDSCNYIDKNEFVFRDYKTSKFYGEQREKLPKELMKILRKWLKYNNKSDYLLYDKNSNKLTPSKLTKRLNNIFGKNVSTSALRHIILSNKYGELIQLKENLNKDLQKMGSSIAQENIYIKK